MISFSVFTAVPVNAESDITTAKIQAVLDKYGYVTGKYWNYEVGGSATSGYMATTHANKAYSYNYNGVECYGFANFVMHKVTGTEVYPGNGNAYGWTKLSSNQVSELRVGDIVRIGKSDRSGHTGVVLSTSNNGSCTFVQCFGSDKSQNKINISNKLWSSSYGNPATLSEMKDTGVLLYVYRYNAGNVSSNPTPVYGSTNPDDYTYPDPDTTDTIYRTSPTMKGSTVAWVQAVLYQLGYSIEVDGSFGQNSEAVIKQFQSDNGLEVDGRVGPATKRKLLERWNEKKHTHSYLVYAESTHPHKEYNKCSCGDIQYTGQVYASWENTGYESAHPHKSYRTCWCGYKEYTGEYKTVYTCDSCLPEKSVLTVVPGTSLDYTSFSWNSASGADYYELIVYNKNDMTTPVEWLYYVPSNHYKMPLPQGDYVAYVASINSALVNSSCWWVYSDKVNFSVSSAGIFAPVASAEYNGNRYEMFDINLPWEVAKAACEELGGHLVTVSSDSELAVIKELSGQGNYTLCWLGITDKDEEGTWKNVTGDAVSYSNWRTGYPDNDNGEEHYGVLLSDGTWGDVSNMYPGKVGFICEYESDNGEDNPTDPVVTWLLGDSNEDGKVNIKDATLIQKSIANLTTLTETGEALADADLNTKINIKDATAIQKHIAGIETGYPIGKSKTK